ncbi:MAG: hypothetical protein M1834_002557 [Cirrosporium novae-zelandiae]|nr:MAG: hypothetical protein M1834_002557 [Cirrosporium novae-zelandiae]
MAPKPRFNKPQSQRITTTLRNICKDYPAGGGILRELLQNADDAGATVVKYVLDKQSYATAPLLDSDLAQYQGPALLAFNDALFKETDFDSLSRIGDSCKADDAYTTGKFGRGFNSVYNWTDSPSIVSGNSFLILDPHHAWSGKHGEPGGPVYDFVADSDDPEMKAHLEAFSPINAKWDEGFNGTVIRLPLRTEDQAKTSQISDRVTSVNEVEETFQAFASELSRSLLFTKSIEKVTLITNNDVLVEVSVVNGDDVKRHKGALNKSLRTSSSGNRPFSIGFQIDIEQRMKSSKDLFQFAVQHQLEGSLSNDELDTWRQKNKVLPWVAVAALLPGFNGNIECGDLFTVMPLNIPTNQPVHIHGIFSVSTDRSHLHQLVDQSIQDKIPGRWNTELIEVVVPKAWGKLLDLLRLIQPGDFTFNNWPQDCTGRGGLFHNICEKVIKFVTQEHLQVWPAHDFGYVHLEEGFLSTGRESDLLKRALSDIKLPVVYVPNSLRDQVTYAFPQRHINPRAVLRHLRSIDLAHISAEAKQTLLDYILRAKFGEIADDLRGIAIFPFEDGVYRSFVDHRAFIHRPGDNALEHQLFSKELDRNIDRSRISAISRTVLDKLAEDSSVGSLCFRGAQDFGGYCQHTWFKDYQNTDFITLQQDAAEFVKLAWIWIGHNSIPLTAGGPLSSLWLVPISGGLEHRKLCPQNPASLVVYASLGTVGSFVKRSLADDVVPNAKLLSVEAFSASGSIQILTKWALKEPNFVIKDMGNLISLIQWLSVSECNLDIGQKGFREELLDIVNGCYWSYPPKDLALLKPPLQKLKLFERMSWKKVNDSLTLQRTLTSLDSPCTYVALKNEVLVPDNHHAIFIYVPPQHQNMVRVLKLAECLSIEEIIGRFIVPALAGHNYDEFSKQDQEKILRLVFRHFFRLSPSVQQRVMPLDIVPVKAKHFGSEKKLRCAPANTLVAPTSNIHGLFFEDEDFLPWKEYYDEFHVVLSHCGLKSTLDVDLMINRIRAYANGYHSIDLVASAALALLQFRPCWRSLDDFPNIRELRELQWLPVKNSQESKSSTNTPGTLSTYLLSSFQCRDLVDRSVIGYVLPTLDIYVSLEWRQFLGWDQPLDKNLLLRQLQYGIQQNDLSVVESVLKYIRESCEVSSFIGVLKTLNCIRTQKGVLVIPHRVFYRSCHLLSPYLYDVDGSFLESFKPLLVELGVHEKPTIEDLLMVQRELDNGQKLSDVDASVAVEILRQASHLSGDQKDLKIITEEGILRPRQDVSFPDLGPTTTNGIKEIYLTHRDIPKSVAKKLHIEPLSERVQRGELGLDDIDDDEEFDQKEEVTTGIADTLERYPCDTTFKEFLANADDCGSATEINWLIDKGQHPQENLLSPQLGGFQGPALFAHNNGTFTEKDFDGFKSVGRGSKRDDAWAIGRFGRGSQTMFHWTDVPMLLSGESLIILDPQQKYLQMNYFKRQRRPGIKLPLSKVRALHPNQLEPFHGLWGYSLDQDYYKGTIFRFPLRNPKTETSLTESTEILDTVRTHEHLKNLLGEARISLLFLKTICFIDFRVRGRLQPEWSVTCDRDDEYETEFSTTVKITCRTFDNSQDQPQISHEIEDRWSRTMFDPSLVPVDLLHKHKRTAKVTECGIAGLLKSKALKGCIIYQPPDYRIFATLPLPFQSPLPVQIHGTFYISGDRQSIAVEGSTEALGAGWNRWLLESALCNLYLGFLDEVGRKVGADVFRFWPEQLPITKSSINDPGNILRNAFWNSLQETTCRLYPVSQPSDSLFSTYPQLKKRRQAPKLLTNMEACFDFMEEEQSIILHGLLSLIFPNLVRLPTRQRIQLDPLHLKVEKMTPDILRDRLVSDTGSRGRLESFLKQSSKDNSVKVFNTFFEFLKPTTGFDTQPWDSCPIVPLADGSFGTLEILNHGEAISKSYYLIDHRAGALLFQDFASDLMINNDIGKPFIKAIIRSSGFNVYTFQLSHLSGLLEKKQWSTEYSDESMIWLKSFWAFFNANFEIDESDRNVGFHSFCCTYGIRSFPLLLAQRNHENIYLQPSQLDNIPYVIDPIDPREQRLFSSIPGLYRLNRKFMPSAFNERHSSLKDLYFMKRFILSLHILASQPSQEISPFFYFYMNREDINIFQQGVLSALKTITQSEKKWTQSKEYRYLREIPLWPMYSRPNFMIDATSARVVSNPRLLPQWVKNRDLFIDPSFYKQHAQTLMKLDIKPVSIMDFLSEWIAPSLPQGKLQNDELPTFLEFVYALSSSGEVSEIQTRDPYYLSSEGRPLHLLLSGLDIAPDSAGVLHRPNELFDGGDEIFKAAFRTELGKKILHPDFASLNGLYSKLGLHRRNNGFLEPDDYLLCVRALNRRMEKDPSDSLLKDDMRLVLSPILGSPSNLANPSMNDWQELGYFVSLISRTEYVEEPTFRRAKMEAIAREAQFIPISLAVPFSFKALCWSQIPFPESYPASHHYHGFSGPPVDSVWKHLEYLKSIVESLDADEIYDFISDVRSTYDYLQNDLAHGINSIPFKRKDQAIWLNIETSESDRLSLDQLKNSWSDTAHLILSSTCDSGSLAALRTFLNPFSNLLKAAGCKSIVYPSVSPSTQLQDASTTDMASQFKEFRQFRALGQGFDIKLLPEGREIGAHKLILASVSGYWKTRFTGPWQNMGSDRSEIPLEDMKYSTVFSLVDFAYRSFSWKPYLLAEDDSLATTADKLDDMLDLLRGADRWTIGELHAQIEDKMLISAKKLVRLDNVKGVVECAGEARALQLRQYCEDFYRENKDTVDTIYANRMREEEEMPALE